MASVAVLISFVAMALIVANAVVTATDTEASKEPRYYGKAHKAKVKFPDGTSDWITTPRTDEILAKVFFPGQENGVFVEIGAFDGVAESNTKYFEDSMGWTGLLVEPYQKAYDILVAKGLRSHSTAVHTAVCRKDMKAKMYLNALRSTLEPSQDEKKSLKTHEIQCTPASALFERHKMNKIDLLVVDVEDAERMVLSTVDFRKASISVVLVEDSAKSCWIKGNSAASKKNVCHEILEKSGFCLAAKVSVNEYWTRIEEQKHLCESPATEHSIHALMQGNKAADTEPSGGFGLFQKKNSLLESVGKAIRAARIPFGRSDKQQQQQPIGAEESTSVVKITSAVAEHAVDDEKATAEDTHHVLEDALLEQAAVQMESGAGLEKPVPASKPVPVALEIPAVSAPEMKRISEQLEAQIRTIFTEDGGSIVSSFQGDRLEEHVSELRDMALRLANERHAQEVYILRRELSDRQQEYDVRLQEVKKIQKMLGTDKPDEHGLREDGELSKKLAQMESMLAESDGNLFKAGQALSSVADQTTKSRSLAAAAEKIRQKLAEKFGTLSAELAAKKKGDLAAAGLDFLTDDWMTYLRQALEQLDLSSILTSVGSASNASAVDVEGESSDRVANVLGATLFIGRDSSMQIAGVAGMAGQALTRTAILLMFVKLLIIAHLCIRLLARKMSMQILVAFVSSNLWTCTLIALARAFAKLDVLEHLANVHHLAVYCIHALIWGQMVIILVCMRKFFFHRKSGIQIGSRASKPAFVFVGSFAISAAAYFFDYFVPCLKGAPSRINTMGLAVIIFMHILMMGAIIVAIGMQEYEVALDEDFDDLDEIDLEAQKVGSSAAFREPAMLRKLRNSVNNAF